MKPNNFIKLPNAKFVITDNCGQEIACGVTDENGKLVFDCLPFGTYFIKEVQPPCGYKPNKEVYKVIICAGSLHPMIEVVNEQEKGSITINKFGC